MAALTRWATAALAVVPLLAIHPSTADAATRPAHAGYTPSTYYVPAVAIEDPGDPENTRWYAYCDGNSGNRDQATYVDDQPIIPWAHAANSFNSRVFFESGQPVGVRHTAQFTLTCTDTNEPVHQF